MKKNSASILLESLVALGMLTLCLLFYQAATLDLVQQERRQYEKLRGTRVLYEEVQEYRLHGGALERQLIYGEERYHVAFTRDLRQAKVQGADYEVAVFWQSQSFHFD